MARVGVLMGGVSAEREVSLRSGEAVSAALRQRGHEVVPVFVDGDIDRVLRATPMDVAFLALHGPYGEDGALQGLLEWMGIPYTGSGVLASALAMDKVKAKELFRLHNVATPAYYALDGEVTERELEEAHGSFGFPVMVKPRRGGSSLGVSRASDLRELAEAVSLAREFDDAVLVERFVKGREVHVGLLGDKVLGAVEIVSKRPFFDYQAKYSKGLCEYYFPARLSPTRYQGVLRLARCAHQALGCVGATRVNILVTDQENESVLEVNTLPGMTPTSILPKIAAGAGIDFPSLCDEILSLAKLHSRSGRRGAEATLAPLLSPAGAELAHA